LYGAGDIQSVGIQPGSRGRGYQASDVTLVEWAIASCGVPFERTTFVDVGCGKGRVLILASRKPFKKIVGFDYSLDLLNSCRKNLKHLGLEERCETDLGDAASFVFPEGELMLFLYNPFDSPLFEAVLERIRAIKDSVTIAYLGPERNSLECSWLREIGRFRSARLYKTDHSAT
jgi:SAM-dependent methyltransferase